MGVPVCLKKISNKNISLFSWLRGILLCICKKIDTYEQLKKKPINKKWFFISVKDDGIYLNDIKIIDKKAELQSAIFKILIDHYLKEFFLGHQYITISEICSSLESSKFCMEDRENQIRVAIYHIRTSINKAHKHLYGNSVIESVK
ncbi:MAG: hypothetical protein LBF54_00920 [Holosporaceae bacterium]|jgi:hypothetical protein|nr:hypothetical protein [Holosporaceae bacterium]